LIAIPQSIMQLFGKRLTQSPHFCSAHVIWQKFKIGLLS